MRGDRGGERGMEQESEKGETAGKMEGVRKQHPANDAANNKEIALDSCYSNGPATQTNILCMGLHELGLKKNVQ